REKWNSDRHLSSCDVFCCQNLDQEHVNYDKVTLLLIRDSRMPTNEPRAQNLDDLHRSGSASRSVQKLLVLWVQLIWLTALERVVASAENCKCLLALTLVVGNV